MKRICAKIRASILVVLSAISVASALQAQAGGQLHLVTGLPTPNDNFTVPSAVYRVEPNNQTATLVAELVGPKDGSIFVQADHDRRVIVIGTSHEDLPRLVVLSMDAPSKPHSNPASYQGWFESFLFEDPQGRLIEAFHIGPCCTQDRLVGFDLLGQDSSDNPQDLPFEGYRSVRRDGAWPPGDDTRVEVFPRATLMLDPNKSLADLGVSLPASFKRERDEFLYLAVNNDEMLVINRAKMPGKELVGEGGATELLIYEKKPQRWSTVHFPGAASAVRGFGHWLALGHADVRRTLQADLSNDWRNERASPGSEQRQTSLRSGSRVQDGGNANVDGLFRASRNYYPGMLYLYDVSSRKRYQIKTDQGDSEVLLVDSDTVYYRVNRNLFSATIGTSSVGNSKLILSDEIVQLSHWAFIGPPSSQ